MSKAARIKALHRAARTPARVPARPARQPARPRRERLLGGVPDRLVTPSLTGEIFDPVGHPWPRSVPGADARASAEADGPDTHGWADARDPGWSPPPQRGGWLGARIRRRR